LIGIRPRRWQGERRIASSRRRAAADTRAMVASGRTRSSAASSAGFSFVELMLVVVILGIVTAVGVQTLDTDELELDATARAIAADLLEVQGLAIQTRIACGLRFDVAGNRCFVVLPDGTTPAASEVALRLRVGLDPDAVDRLLAARPTGQNGFGAVRLTTADFASKELCLFQTDGTPQQGGLVQIDLGRSALRVRVQPVTGRIVVTAP
jgi:prepilin-type N-terminal cleavage/methylation domain-containing protein